MSAVEEKLPQPVDGMDREAHEEVSVIQNFRFNNVQGSIRCATALKPPLRRLMLGGRAALPPPS
jgi:hypothetical protein